MARPEYPVANSPWEELPKQSRSAPLLAQLGLILGVQYVAVRPPPGPRSAGLNTAAGLEPGSSVRSRRTYSAETIRVIGELCFTGPGHSARPIEGWLLKW